MSELGFRDQNQRRSGYGVRDVSPDSVIFTVDSNFSLFSSASGSVDRCSFASDVHDQESFGSEISQHLAVHELREISSGPDSDPNKCIVHKNRCLGRKVQKAKGLKDYISTEIEHNNQIIDSARSSFSQALKDCQDRRSRSEALLQKPDRRRPASLDLNNCINATSSSPRLGVMKKNSAITRRTGTFPSPGTPNYRHASVGIQKGWSSERVPLHTNANRRQMGAALLPFNNGRMLPSKWEDAERWIFSPVGADGVVKPSLPQPQRRPKAKSGPLGPPGVAYYTLYSPAVPMLEGGNFGNSMSESPFSAGVMDADGLSIRGSRDHAGNRNFRGQMEPCMARSVSVHGCSELLSKSVSLGPHEEKLEYCNDAANNISRDISRRDMATQMSPEGSLHSTSDRRPSFSPSTPSVLPIVELQHIHSSKVEVRDVQVDERVTMSRWSKKHKAHFPGKGGLGNADDCKKKGVEARYSAWDISENAKTISKVKREEAKISAWENLQKAKAEAEIRKLEMKLEKKRSTSMDKIMNKLRSAQRKAQEMRSSTLTNQPHHHQVVTTTSSSSQKSALSFRRTRQISSLSGCFTCHAF